MKSQPGVLCKGVSEGVPAALTAVLGSIPGRAGNWGNELWVFRKNVNNQSDPTSILSGVWRGNGSWKNPE